MFEFTTAFLKAFSWAKQTYSYLLGFDPSPSISITSQDLTRSIASSLYPSPNTIASDSDWNNYSASQIANLGGMYKTADQADAYYTGLYTLVDGRIGEAETRVSRLESDLRSIISKNKFYSTESITINGGDTTLLETNDSYYIDFDSLIPVPSENIFRLRDTGFFSAIRSSNFPGQLQFEASLGQIVSNGNVYSIVDGSRNTFWIGTYYASAPIRASSNDVPWLPTLYKDGFAFQLTYYIDRPILATEVYIDPVTTEPYDLVSVSWTPSTVSNTLKNGDLSSNSIWSYLGSATYSSNLGISNGAIVATNSSGYASQTFTIPYSFLTSSSSSLVGFGSRAELQYTFKGIGASEAGCRIVWLDSSGTVINYSKNTGFPSAFFSTQRMVDFIPSNAASGRIDVGIFSSSTNPGSAIFDNLTLYLGEESYQVGASISSTTTISLPKLIHSSRVSFIFAQRNPRKEIITKTGTDINFSPLNSTNINIPLQKSVQNQIDNLSSFGPQTSTFAYRIGMKELDLRYREHYPRGSIVSVPLRAGQEIRELWVTSEMGFQFAGDANFCIYPSADNPAKKVYVSPFLTSNLSYAQGTSLQDGDVVKIFTTEESSVYASPSDKTYITDPVSVKDTLNGTDTSGKILLSNPIHLRRVQVSRVSKWLDNYSIYPSSYDANLGTLFGVANQSIINQLRSGNYTSISLTNLVSSPGYQPIKVTVETSNFVAYPDVFGVSQGTSLAAVVGEALNGSLKVSTTTNTTTNTPDFSSWLNSTLGSTILSDQALVATLPYTFVASLQASPNLPLITIYNQTSFPFGSEALKKLQVVYNNLKSQGKLTSTGGNTSVSTSTNTASSFVTSHYPLVTGAGGAYLKLYWVNSLAVNSSSYTASSLAYMPIPKSGYIVADYLNGIIEVTSPQPSGFDKLYIDYIYISQKNTDDYLSSTINSISPISKNSIIGELNSNARVFPITRNMTDYTFGTIPKLTIPDFDPLSYTYYPIIEYYVSNDNHVVFSRDFFAYGDLPAKITIEYESLKINPRVAVEVIRTGSSASTPTIYNVSLNVRENLSSVSNAQ
jgi:hypothetical protein